MELELLCQIHTSDLLGSLYRILNQWLPPLQCKIQQDIYLLFLLTLDSSDHGGIYSLYSWVLQYYLYRRDLLGRAGIRQ